MDFKDKHLLYQDVNKGKGFIKNTKFHFDPINTRTKILLTLRSIL